MELGFSNYAQAGTREQPSTAIRGLRVAVHIFALASMTVALIVALSDPALASHDGRIQLPALSSYIEQQCDFTKSQWCRLKTVNRFEDVMWHKDIPGRSGCCHNPKKVFTDYNGAAFDGRSFYFHGGGHASYAGNEVYRLDLATLTWTRLSDPAPLTDTDFIGKDCPVPATGIYAGHTYGSPLVYKGVLHVWSQYPKCDGHKTSGPPVYSEFDLSTGKWAPMTALDHSTSAVAHIGSRAVVFGQGRGARAYLIDLDTMETIASSGPAERGWVRFGAATMAGDDAVLLGKVLHRINVEDFSRPEQVAKPPPSLGDNGGIAYDPGRSLFFLWSGGPNVFAIDADFEKWRIYTDDGPDSAKNVFSKWRYIPGQDVFLGIADSDHLWLFRPGEPIDPQKALGEFECSDFIPGAECPNLQQSVNQGGTVTLKKGVYRQCAVISSPIVIEGNGAVVKGHVCQNKAAFVINADTVIRNLSCENHRIAAGNGACIRQQKGDLVLDNVEIRNSQNGILAGRKAGDLTIQNSLLEKLGGDCSVKCGRAHGIYYEGNGTLAIRDSTIRKPRDQGHLIKTGAKRTVLENVVLDETDGSGSRIIDAYNGGELIIRNSKLIAASGDGNSDLIGYDTESRRSYRKNQVVIEQTQVHCAGGQLIGGRDNLDDARLTINATLQGGCR